MFFLDILRHCFQYSKTKVLHTRLWLAVAVDLLKLQQFSAECSSEVERADLWTTCCQTATGKPPTTWKSPLGRGGNQISKNFPRRGFLSLGL